MMKRLSIILFLICGIAYGETSTGGTHNQNVRFDSKIDLNNTTTNALGSSSNFVGTATDLQSFPGGVNIMVETDAAGSATKGLLIEYSDDGTDWHVGESYTIPANATKFYSAPAWMRYYRISYTNGAIAQTNFHLHAFIKKVVGKPSSHNSNESINDEDDGELVVSVIQARNDDTATWNPVKSSEDGNLLVHDAENPTAIAFGSVTTKSVVQKFGNAPNFATADNEVSIWDGADSGGIDANDYTYSATNDIDSIVSSSAADLQEIEIQGLDGDGYLVLQNATLTGQTRVALATNLWRVFRMKNVGTSNIAGNVSCYVTNAPTTGGVVDDSSLVRAQIIDGNNQTEMALYTVPRGKEAVIASGYVWTSGASKSSDYVVKFKARPFGRVFQLKYRASFSDDLQSGFSQSYKTGLYFDELTDLELTVQALAAGMTGASMAGGFEIILNDK